MEPPEIPADPADPSRRRFLSLVAASTALAASVSCSRNIDRSHAIPYTTKTEGVVPGVASCYATAFQEGEHAYGLLVTVREGKPIHVEGNDLDPLHAGKAPLRAIADLLGLYDPDRAGTPLSDGKPVGVEDATARSIAGLREACAAGKGVLLLTPALLSPTRRALIAALGGILPTLRHVAWEPISDPNARRAASEVFGSSLRPDYRYDRARLIVSLDADFLGTWGDATRASRLFAKGRGMPTETRPMNRLVVFEGGLSITGSNADRRFPVRPSLLPRLPFVLARLLSERHGLALPAGFDASSLTPHDRASFASASGVAPGDLDHLAGELATAGSASLLLAGPSLSPEGHAGCHLLHAMLGAEGVAADVSESTGYPAVGEDFSGEFGAVLFWDVNPAFALGEGPRWQKDLGRIPFRVHMGQRADETSAASHVFIPVSHPLESWGDYEVCSSALLLQQPACRPIFGARQAEDLLLDWAAALGAAVPGGGYRAFLKSRWEREIYRGGPVPFESFWNACLHEGVYRLPARPGPPRTASGPALSRAAAAVPVRNPSGTELLLHPSHKLFDGRYANNGWLQELPDPVSKTTWGSPARLSKTNADDLGIRDGDIVSIRGDGGSWSGPALVQPGQAPGVVSLSLGYGRRSGSVASGIGSDAFPLAGGPFASDILPVEVARAQGRQPLHATQWHGSQEGRRLALSGTPEEFRGDHPHGHGELADLYPPQKYGEHRWGMSVDLSACTGCSGCVVACQSENNIPVVGPEQVERGRAMHWIRVDRYYGGSADNPSVTYQPMLCQQCGSAPCENVCPVNATNHSPEGLNQMAYNRCVGTRYCANNCPYKVRRFNFFDFTKEIRAPLGLAFNPEVSVRPRGVMEKCTFCVQRIQDAKQVAKATGRPLRDGDVRPACAAACPTDAIVFGDLMDPGSAVSARSADPRGFKVLEELGVKPAITYLARLRNPGGASDRSRGAHDEG